MVKYIYYIYMNTLFVIFLIITISICTVVPVIGIDKYSRDKNTYWLILSLIVAIISMLSYYRLILEGINISIAFPIIKSLAILIMISFGIIYMHDVINMRLIVGMTSLIAAIFLLSGDL